MNDGSVKRHLVHTTAEGTLGSAHEEVLAVEEPLEVRVVGPRSGPVSLAVTMRTPGQDFELAVGFLFSEGIIRRREDIRAISYCRDHGDASPANVVIVTLEDDGGADLDRFSRHVFTTSSCGICGTAALEFVRALRPPTLREKLRVSREVIFSLPETLARAQTMFGQTGGVHASALYDLSGRLRLVREDVGRHNAMDKVIGSLVMNGRVPAAEAIALVSGRASFELVHKALLAGIPILAAVGAPSSLAVEVASDAGMTLIGFLRGRRFTIYCGPERIV